MLSMLYDVALFWFHTDDAQGSAFLHMEDVFCADSLQEWQGSDSQVEVRGCHVRDICVDRCALVLFFNLDVLPRLVGSGTVGVDEIDL